MKHKKSLMLTIAGIAICLLTAIGMAGCGSSEEAAAPEETTQAAVEETTVEETTAAETTQAPEQTEIGEDKALKIALKDAGLSKKDVDYSNSHLDYDDGITKYEVQFRQGTKEYEYDIDAYTGAILDKDIDYDND